MPGIDGPLEILLLAILFLVIPITLIIVGIKKFSRRSKGRVALFVIGILGLLFIPLLLFYEFVLVPYLHFPYPNVDEYTPESQSVSLYRDNSSATQNLWKLFDSRTTPR